MQQHVYAISATCAALGIRHAVICPGSRSAPLVYAFVRSGKFSCYSVVDERSAAYMALGMAQQLQEPVALICTSGTAALNFYPAVAEAFYQRVPLVVITADRPAALLHQQDGQMIAQEHLYQNNCVGSVTLPGFAHSSEDLAFVSGKVSELIMQSIAQRGPVHINVPLEEPLYPNSSSLPRIPALPSPKGIAPQHISAEELRALQEAWMGSRRKLILVGQEPLNMPLFSALHKLALQQDAVILCDVLSNLHSIGTAPHFDMILSQSQPATLEQLQPDMLISIGGPVLSKSLRLWLKKQQPAHHYRIEAGHHNVNTYGNVTHALRGNAASILASLPASAKGGAYYNSWKQSEAKAASVLEKYLAKAPFSELVATSMLMQALPVACNFHVANSSSIRYVSNLGNPDPSWVMSGNRGTSGIDGCTSTAVGAAMVNNRPTVLLTGDLGFLYDRNALWNAYVHAGLRIVVLNNSGGGIFRLIEGPGRHPAELNYFTTPHQQGIRHTALDNGLDHYFCDSPEGLQKQLQTFFRPSARAAVLEIKTDLHRNAALFKQFKQLKIS